MFKPITLALVSAFALAITPSLALADKDFLGTDGGSHDCTEDATVNINNGSGTYTLTGACKQVNLNGGKLTVSIADVDELNINGAGNTITVDAVGAIHINGAKNKVTWKKAKTGKKPGVMTNGKGNSVAKAK